MIHSWCACVQAYPMIGLSTPTVPNILIKINFGMFNLREKLDFWYQ